MMDPEIKKQWIDALRSGKFTQGREQLQDESGYCCLGVLAQIVDPNRETWKSNNIYFAGGDMCQDELVGGKIPFYILKDLANRNDGSEGFHRHTFEEIANIIEKDLEI